MKSSPRSPQLEKAASSNKHPMQPERKKKELKKSMRIMSQQIENNNKEVKIIKTNQIEILRLKSTITKVKNSLQKLSSRIEQAEV